MLFTLNYPFNNNSNSNSSKVHIVNNEYRKHPYNRTNKKPTTTTKIIARYNKPRILKILKIRNGQPWMNHSIKQLIRKRQRLYRDKNAPNIRLWPRKSTEKSTSGKKFTIDESFKLKSLDGGL